MFRLMVGCIPVCLRTSARMIFSQHGVCSRVCANTASMRSTLPLHFKLKTRIARHWQKPSHLLVLTWVLFLNPLSQIFRQMLCWSQVGSRKHGTALHHR